MAVQLHAPTRLQSTKTLPLPSLLGPNGNNVGLKGPADRFALKSSFFSPSLHLLIASYNQKQSLASAAPRFSMRAATKQAYICRDCGYIYNDRKPFDRLPDNYFCPASSIRVAVLATSSIFHAKSSLCNKLLLILHNKIEAQTKQKQIEYYRDCEEAAKHASVSSHHHRRCHLHRESPLPGSTDSRVPGPLRSLQSLSRAPPNPNY